MGDRQRFERVYAAHYEAVLRYCLRRASREDAMDAAAETFTVAWRRCDGMPDGRELPWLYGVARRVLANQRRAHERVVRTARRLRVVGAEPTFDPDLQLVRDQESLEVAEALNRLKANDREVIRLAGWEELSRDDIAVALDCTPNAVTKRLNRALDHLAHEMGVVERVGGRFFGRGEVGR